MLAKERNRISQTFLVEVQNSTTTSGVNLTKSIKTTNASQTEKDKYRIVSLICEIKNKQTKNPKKPSS